MTTTAELVAAPPLALLSAAVDAVVETEWSRLGEEELLAAIRQLEQARRRLEALDSPVIAEVESRNLPGKYVCRSTGLFLSGLLKLSARESTSRVRRVRALGPRPALSGDVLPPLLPATAAARAAGSITAQHADVITRALERVHNRVPTETVAQAEELLVEQSGHFDAVTVAGIARQLLDTIDPDGVLPDEQQQRQRRYLSCTPRADGMYRLGGVLDSETAALAMTVLHSLAAPRPTGAARAADAGNQDAADSADRSGSSGAGSAEASADRDERTSGQRLHDAFRSVLSLALRSEELPGSGGTPATVLITMTAEQFESGAGLATTGFGQKLRVDRALRLAGAARIAWVVHNSRGGVLAYGRAARLASPGQTLALIARDGGCSFPGCADPPEWTERHHVVPWSQGGATDLDNLCLLCDFHHDRIDSGGWRVEMRDGSPWFTPPAWLDPAQIPRRNLRP